MSGTVEGSKQSDRAFFHVVKTLAVHCQYDVCSANVGILQGVERPWFVYSIMPQW